MSENSRWMWYFGDYEIFHSLLLHTRRQEFGADYPTFWNQSHVYPNVVFRKYYSFDEPTTFRTFVKGVGYVFIDNSRYATGKTVTFPAGKHKIEIHVANPRGIPATYVEGEKIFSDGTWTASPATTEYLPVGTMEEYSSPEDDVEVFPFSYRRMDYLSVENTDGGFLYDFGREVFGKLILTGVKKDTTVYYGESAEEATDRKNAILFEEIKACGKLTLVPRAFRYVFIDSDVQPDGAALDFEYLPIKDVGAFSCDDPDVEKIYRLCAYTFHLNSREFYLDGIKRDRWVWSGDAYQSYMVNEALYYDPAIVRRTILALLGKPPYAQHINTINDYSAYLIISVYDYWFTYGDKQFVSLIWNRVKALYDYIVSRLDENGFVCYRPGDWIFIDWADLDKEGPMCAEQIIFWKCTKCIKELAALTGNTVDAPDEEVLKKKIYDFYYDKEKGAFIDGYVSGKKMINRQQNVLALLYGFTDEKESELIMKNVLCNPAVKPITTPYFEFFELLAMCKFGNVEYAQDMITSYWGEMLRLGATSVWEEFDPKKSGVDHYGMYGNRFGKSLCHAWGSGPVCLLGKYIAGVRATKPGWEEYEVCPVPGIYKSFNATVPAGKGKVSVRYGENGVTVLSDRDGGTLRFGGKEYKIEKNKPISVK